MQHVNGVPVYTDDPVHYYDGLDEEPTWFSAQGGVYRCKSRKPPFTQVAIKKYLVEETDRYPDLFVMPKELVENEIYTMTKCIHPNILKLLAVYLHEEFVFLVMPYCTGGSLQQYVFEHHLTVGQLVHIIKSIASGLAEIHRHGYFHRDIKCDNIFLDKESNSVVIGDFGVVSVTPAADSNVEEAGVVLFWSPELVQRKIVNRKVDIWALGIVILEILNGGKAPYEDEKLDEEEIKQRILENGKPEYPPNLPSRLVHLLDRCLNPDPKLRISAADILQHPFLCDYEPEPLFPGNRIDDDSHDESMSISENDENVAPNEDDLDDKAMATAIKKLRALEALHEINIGATEIPATMSPSTSSHLKQSDSVKHDTTNSSTSIPSRPSLSPPGSGDVSNEPSTSSLDTNRSETHSATTSTSKRQQPVASDIRRCRIPKRSFTVSEDEIGSISTHEQILSVLKKRQSISDMHWSQGSRLPMFKAMMSINEDAIPEEKMGEKKIRRAKSVKLRDDRAENTDNKPVRKPLVRANTMPSQSTSLLSHKKQRSTDKPPPTKRPDSAPSKNNTSSQRNNVRSPIRREITSPRPMDYVNTKPRPKVLLASGRSKKDTEPPKKRLSIYRRKCPPGESRTARLMMGISTTGRGHSSSRQQQSETDTAADDGAGRRYGKYLRFNEPAVPEHAKKRPVSVGGGHMKQETEDKKRLSSLQPETTRTTPLPRHPQRQQQQRSGNEKANKSAALKGVKVVRVH